MDKEEEGENYLEGGEGEQNHRGKTFQESWGNGVCVYGEVFESRRLVRMEATIFKAMAAMEDTWEGSLIPAQGRTPFSSESKKKKHLEMKPGTQAVVCKGLIRLLFFCSTEL